LLPCIGDLFAADIGAERWEAAKALIPELKTNDPSGRGAEVAEARIAEHEGRNGDAINLFERARRVNPSNGAICVFLGDALLKAGRIEEARRAYSASLSCALDANLIKYVQVEMARLSTPNRFTKSIPLGNIRN
jgi:Flp pilus assembly protein TadD